MNEIIVKYNENKAEILSKTVIQLLRASGVCASAIQRLKVVPKTLIPPTTALIEGIQTKVFFGNSSKNGR